MWTVIKQTIKLLIKSYLPLFPFVFCFVISIHFTDKLFPTPLLLKSFLTLLLTIFFFSCVLYGTNQRYQNSAFNHAYILLKGFKRFFPALASFLIILSPAFLIGLLLRFFGHYVLPSHGVNEFNPNAETLLATFFMLVITIAMIAWMVIVLYFYFAMYFIVIKENTPFKGLERSWALIQGHWFKTFFLMLILTLMTALLHYTFNIIITKFVKEAVSLIITPLSASLMIIYHDYLATKK